MQNRTDSYKGKTGAILGIRWQRRTDGLYELIDGGLGERFKTMKILVTFIEANLGDLRESKADRAAAQEGGAE